MKCLKKIIKWTGVILGGLVAIALVANALFLWITSTQLERQLAALRAAGEPLTLAELAPTPIPPEENAAIYLRRIPKEDIEAIENIVAVPEVMSLINSGNNPYPLSSEVQAKIKSAFDASPNTIPLLHQAIACPDYDPQLDYSESNPGVFTAELFSEIQMLRAYARVLQYRIWLLVAEKQHDEAIRTAIDLFRLSRHAERQPGLVGYLVAIAIRGMAINTANLVLQTGPISQESQEALDAELTRHDSLDGYERALKFEQIFANTPPWRYYFSPFENGGLALFGDCWFIGRGVWNIRETRYLEKLHEFFLRLRKPLTFREAEAFFDTSYLAYTRALRADPIGTTNNKRLFSIFQTFYVAIKDQSDIRSLRILNALLPRVRANTEDMPKLSELGLPPEKTTDPFTGEPLHIKKTTRGYKVYSVGPDFRDDGGRFSNDPTMENTDIGIGPPLPPAKPVQPLHDEGEIEK